MDGFSVICLANAQGFAKASLTFLFALYLSFLFATSGTFYFRVGRIMGSFKAPRSLEIKKDSSFEGEGGTQSRADVQWPPVLSVSGNMVDLHVTLHKKF